MDRILEDISKWPIEKRRSMLEQVYEQRVGVPLDLDNPKRFTEKIQWRKLHDTNPLISYCIDKLSFKQYVREKLGEGYTAPLIDVWHSPDDVIYSSIPDNCVIKSNCQGGGKYIYIVIDRTCISEDQLSKIKQSWFDKRYLNTNSLFMAYHSVRPCVIIEQYLSEVATGIDEYKFYCFDGKPYLIYHADQHIENGQMVDEYPISFYSIMWEYKDIQYGDHISSAFVSKPVYLEEMIEVSRILSKGFSFVRVDFFGTSDRFYLAEMTFTPGAGYTRYYPDDVDFELGKMWVLK